jgi:hypothetical protein
MTLHQTRLLLISVEDRLHPLGIHSGRLDSGALDLQ